MKKMKKMNKKLIHICSLDYYYILTMHTTIYTTIYTTICTTMYTTIYANSDLLSGVSDFSQLSQSNEAERLAGGAGHKETKALGVWIPDEVARKCGA